MKNTIAKGGDTHMYKSDISNKIAKITDLDEASARKILNLFLSEVIQGLKKGKKVTLTGFGTFEVRKTKKRSAHNIHTEKMMIVPAHKRVAFKVGGPLKRLVK